MIIIKLMGGVGNQMFQYALGRHLAEKNNVELKMDLSFLKARPAGAHYTFRDYELGIFNIKENFAAPRDLSPALRLLDNRYFRGLVKVLKKLGIGWRPGNYFKEPDTLFHPEVLGLKDGAYLEGYWQSEKYFTDIGAIIRREFTLKPELLEKVDPGLLREIRNVNSVSFNVRRGDYVTNKGANAFHGVAPLDYYREAVKIIGQKVEEPVFFVVSDDIEWCRQNIKLDYPVRFIGGNKYYQDLFLTSQCKHNIITNSSFTWWGAWLNDNAGKIVIAPKKWFNDPSVDTRDIVPASWLRI